MKVIVCDKCFNIPKITIVNTNQIQLECSTCNTILSFELDYFNRFINIKENDDLFKLPDCNYIKNHSAKAILYCFKCGKYICNNCLNNHNDIFEGKGHITINQKISHQYFCKNHGIEENRFFCFCTKCNNYQCYECKCEHQNEDKYYFNNDEIKINEIRNKINKCQKIIEEQEKYLNDFISNINNKIKSLTDMFNDYKKRNTDLISFYNILINNYDQMKNIKNYNIRNNIFLNDNFNFGDSNINNDECLMSKYNRLSDFYMNTRHIKTKEYIDSYISPKFCYDKIKKCLILNDKIVCFIFDKEIERHICFIYKNNKNENRLMRMFHDDFIKDAYPLEGNKYMYLDVSNNLTICQIDLSNDSFGSSEIKRFNSINFAINDVFNKNNFFIIQNNEKHIYFILKYYINNEKNKDGSYENSLENKNNMYLIIKERKKFSKYLMDDILKIIEDSNINNAEKKELSKIFKYKNENEINIDKLININNELLNLIQKVNENAHNKIKNIINDTDSNCVINSNYIIKCIKKLDKNNLNQNEKNVVNNADNFNELSKKIIEKYIHYLIYNSKINNIYNYNNKFLLFMEENYLIIPYSLTEKKFLGLETANLIENRKNYNNFEIIGITPDKIVINNIEDKLIYVIENNDSYNFCLVKTFNYYFNAQVSNNYLLLDKNNNNKYLFSLINLNDYKFDYKLSCDFNQLLNFKIKNNNPPKIILNQDFHKFLYLYEDKNQLGLIDCTFDKKIEYSNKNKQNLKIILTKDNLSEIVPTIYDFSSYYKDDKDYEPNNVLKDKGYYCTKTNKNEYITFKFDKEYCLLGFSIEYPDSYEKARPKEIKVTIYDNQKRELDSFGFTDLKLEAYFCKINLDDKGAYLKLQFIDNFGSDYFCIEKVRFFADITHSINIK